MMCVCVCVLVSVRMYVSAYELVHQLTTQALIDRYGVAKVYPSVVYFEDFTIQQLALLLGRARMLVAPHGAGNANVVLMRPGRSACVCMGRLISLLLSIHSINLGKGLLCGCVLDGCVEGRIDCATRC